MARLGAGSNWVGQPLNSLGLSDHDVAAAESLVSSLALSVVDLVTRIPTPGVLVNWQFGGPEHKFLRHVEAVEVEFVAGTFARLHLNAHVCGWLPGVDADVPALFPIVLELSEF